MSQANNSKPHIDLSHVQSKLADIFNILKRKKASKSIKWMRAIKVFSSLVGLLIIFFCGIFKDTKKENLQNTLNSIDQLRGWTSPLQLYLSSLEGEIREKFMEGRPKVESAMIKQGFVDAREAQMERLLFEWCKTFLSVRNNGNQMLWADSAKTKFDFWGMDTYILGQKNRLQGNSYNLDSLIAMHADYSFQQIEIEQNINQVDAIERRINTELKDETSKYFWLYILGSVLVGLSLLIEQGFYIWRSE